MKYRLIIVGLFLASLFLAFSCTKETDYYKSENPKARSNQYYAKRDKDIEMENFDILDKNDPDSTVGCSFIPPTNQQ